MRKTVRLLRSTSRIDMNKFMTRMMKRFVLGIGLLFLAVALQPAFAQGSATPPYLDTNLTLNNGLPTWCTG